MRGTKDIRWGTPKHIQREVENNNPNRRPGIKKWACKKNKGDHEFEYVLQPKNAHFPTGTLLRWMRKKEVWTYKICKHCGKQEYQSMPLEDYKKLDLDFPIID